MKNLDAAAHEALRSALAPWSPSRDDGLDPVPSADERKAARALRGRWDPADGDVRDWLRARAPEVVAVRP